MDTSHSGSDWQDIIDHQRSHHWRQAAVPCASLQHGRAQCSYLSGSTCHHQRDNAWVFTDLTLCSWAFGHSPFPFFSPRHAFYFEFFLSQNALKFGSQEISARLSWRKLETLWTLWFRSRWIRLNQSDTFLKSSLKYHDALLTSLYSINTRMKHERCTKTELLFTYKTLKLTSNKPVSKVV